ncbi:anthrone oxygenase family protein [Microtetraspora sp. NBRC 16547]|uniref:anthrone oxygenase family protein n=1 Tax=Microtetraspora sp. NBRC 16547 TaxID=3030993 RepID=UPI0024A48881|nr:anthrone oxygenase family protein [Microtetraspora sp. NBRC 16547]GLW98532.1 membrane protein [Microtetraspora sp. NBRC 16547]
MLFALTAVSAAVALLLTGAIAGLFYGYSVSVMPGLDGIAAEHAIPAMRRINEKILNPRFFASFLGTPVASAVTGGLLLALGEPAAAVLFFAAAATYVLGAFVPTAAVNVPMNQALAVATVPADPAEAARLWSEFSGRWTRWNTSRAVFCLISLLLAGLGLYVWARP